MSPSFRAFVAEEGKSGVDLNVDHLLILQYLMRHAEIDSATAARICQRPQAGVRDVLSRMERGLGYVDRGGAGKGTYWTLRPRIHERIAAPGDPERVRRLNWDVAKTRVLSILKQKSERGEVGLSNKEIRSITLYNRDQVGRMMRELRREVPQVTSRGHGAGARYFWEE